MATQQEITISTDEDAVALLSIALETPAETEGAVLVFDNWPQVEIKLTGTHYEGTITANAAQMLIEYQKAFEHAFLELVKPKSTRLTNSEKKDLAITAEVKKGSTLLTLDFNAALTQLSTQLVGKMTPNEILIAILGLGTIAGATFVVKTFVKERATRLTRTAELDSQTQLSEQETKRLQIVTQAMQAQPKLAFVKDDFDNARDAVLRNASDANTLSLDGVKMTSTQAVQMARQPRESSKEAQLNGVYYITGVSWPDDVTASLELRGLENSREFKATLNTESLLQKDKSLIASAEWGRTPLYLSINAKLLRDNVISATVVGFDWDRLRSQT
ncbi:hypothetical protein [Diaphorobacter caeni]|uniref:hypothetical protein n=1 Tax=Diaphorobacter caeni TaxID=2784387 RepID=UPI00188FEC65|nr:hypothetical protein [Diaphorobacter caeni]MBF5006386.1 hypothetical protein [Diaphorobacter caeni]